ncbi:MAG: FAD-binding oxidoreductase [Candidatus Dormibacteraeota bacterium]|nr:FAD-binding oxidoreductase [Candidatus Dormibacteraeota bacterium]
MTVTSIPGGSQGLSTSEDLRQQFAGALLEPGAPGYDEARRVANGRFVKRPALIARCTGTKDVQAALAYARANGLQVAVRCGSHSTAGFSSTDGGIVIDVGPMKASLVDASARTGRFGAGMTWADLDAATQEHGLAVTGGRVSDTGVTGLTLGSGSGWLERALGPTADSLLSAEVVTASGEVVRAGAGGDPELLWGLAGGGGNFGVVTELEFRLHPVGPIVFAGLILHPRSVGGELMRFYRDFMNQAPEEVGGGLALITAPPAPFVPEEVRLKLVCALIVVYTGDPADGPAALAPLLRWREPLVSMVQPMPYTALQKMLDEGNPFGIREYAKVDYLRELPDPAIDAMLDEAARVSSPMTTIVLCPGGGALSRRDPSAVSLVFPDVPWFYQCISAWPDVLQPDEPHIAWTRGFMEAMRPWALDEAPVNFIAVDEPESRLRRSFGEEKFARLTALKDRYDPANVFALNQNIPPSGHS